MNVYLYERFAHYVYLIVEVSDTPDSVWPEEYLMAEQLYAQMLGWA